MQHIYSFIRKDLPLPAQLVQTAHSAFHAGESFGDKSSIPSLVLLEVQNYKELLETSIMMNENNIKFSMFYEPDDDMKHTSITTEPLDMERRKVFSNYKLWRA